MRTRYVLWTRGDDFVRLDANDFHVQTAGHRASELLIRCSFDGLSPDEESRFLEWCTNQSGTRTAMPSMALQASETVGGQPQTLIDTMRETDCLIDQNSGVKGVQDAVNTTFLLRLHVCLRAFLRKLPGGGSTAELLLLQSQPGQVPFLLIEEPEAHLHPQHQTLFRLGMLR